VHAAGHYFRRTGIVKRGIGLACIYSNTRKDYFGAYNGQALNAERPEMLITPGPVTSSGFGGPGFAFRASRPGASGQPGGSGAGAERERRRRRPGSPDGLDTAGANLG
jgi:hypothetical protein